MCSVGLCTVIAIAMLVAHAYNRTVELDSCKVGDDFSAKPMFFLFL